MSFLECASILAWVLEALGHCVFKRELRITSQIIVLRLVINNPGNCDNFRLYPYYFPNIEQAFPYENVIVGDILLKGPRGSSPYDATLPWPTESWC